MRKGWRKREHMPGRAKRGARVFAVLLALLCAFRLAGVHELIPITWLHRPPDGVQHLIDANAERFSLDKDLLQAVILTESHFDEDAVSETGAVGMMQLMPDTAEWIAEESGLPGGDLTDPKKNIPLGSWYLDYLLKKYEGNLVLALAAYNAGRGNVDSWMEEREWPADYADADGIPFSETREFVKMVCKVRSELAEEREEGLWS